MVHDQVGHDVVTASEGLYVAPGSDAGVDGGVVDRVESGIRAVDRYEERQQMDAAECSREGFVDQFTGASDVAGEAVGVGDQLRGVSGCHR